MSNSQIKKARAIAHNKAFDDEKALAQDKIDNPEKYIKRRRKRTRKEMQALVTIATMTSMIGCR